ncbi:hypothetical protein F7Q99_38800 [Streptomyces kaniharaensis]|uniref:Uncharacterized protein n=1 Tax=Streptomyces kaniharaensis TaxID=212423 RepID=A0A6N7L6W5_9ACTN|nr:hypothetical protein [Streptomyces kaniharaensis]MQS17983.1 hypothetical protein [Streptomyces kaniharaensis]
MIERSGHHVVLDHQGLAIDGQRICQTPSPRPDHPARPGRHQPGVPGHRRRQVIYRGRMVAEIGPSPAGTATPGS